MCENAWQIIQSSDNPYKPIGKYEIDDWMDKRIIENKIINIQLKDPSLLNKYNDCKFFEANK
jgi:hypothetical protein